MAVISEGLHCLFCCNWISRKMILGLIAFVISNLICCHFYLQLGVMKESAVNVPSSSPSPKPVPKSQEPQMTAPPPPAPIPETQVSSLKATENGNVQEGECAWSTYSSFVKLNW